MSAAPDAVQLAAGRLLPVAELFAKVAASLGQIKPADIDAGRAIVETALDEGLTRSQCESIHAELQDAERRALVIELCGRLGLEADVLTVLAWVQGEVAAGGTRAEPLPAAAAPGRLDPAATCWLVSEDLSAVRTLRMFAPGFDDSDREAALDWLVQRGYGLCWIAMSITDGDRTSRGEWIYSAADRARVRHWMTAAQAKGLRVAITLGLNHCRSRPWLDQPWVAAVLADVGDLVEWAAVAVEADETATAEQVREVCGWIHEADLPAAVHCENPDHYPAHGAAAGIWLWQMRSWQGGTTAARAVAEYQEAKRKAGPGRDVYWWEFAFGDAPAALAIGDAVRAAGCPCAAPSTPRRGAVAQPEPAASAPAPADAADLSRVTKDRIAGEMRSARLSGETVTLEYTVPEWPRSGDKADIILTLMVGRVDPDGVVRKAHRFEHGRRRPEPRDAKLIWEDGFQRTDTLVVWACASILNPDRKDERTNAVRLEI